MTAFLALPTALCGSLMLDGLGKGKEYERLVFFSLLDDLVDDGRAINLADLILADEDVTGLSLERVADIGLMKLRLSGSMEICLRVLLLGS